MSMKLMLLLLLTLFLSGCVGGKKSALGDEFSHRCPPRFLKIANKIKNYHRIIRESHLGYLERKEMLEEFDRLCAKMEKYNYVGECRSPNGKVDQRDYIKRCKEIIR